MGWGGEGGWFEKEAVQEQKTGNKEQPNDRIVYCCVADPERSSLPRIRINQIFTHDIWNSYQMYPVPGSFLPNVPGTVPNTVTAPMSTIPNL